jgi:hypothetical protein
VDFDAVGLAVAFEGAAGEVRVAFGKAVVNEWVQGWRHVEGQIGIDCSADEVKVACSK